MFSATLAAYGHLKSSYQKPPGAHLVGVDQVKGWMFVRKDGEKGGDPALVRPGADLAPWVDVEILKVPRGNLIELDKEEEKAGYRRETIKTRKGRKAFIYVWQGSVPSGVQTITHWDDPEHKSRKRI